MASPISPSWAEGLIWLGNINNLWCHSLAQPDHWISGVKHHFNKETMICCLVSGLLTVTVIKH